ncbi:MAG TPA: hypothetical protein PLL44_05180 [Novosphingobium sp.]|jgi:hypothetical protein|nr:hypothetical protein [Novosphingobium sp.]HQN53804.1 hypothetical protein [Novosphingobium sp.]HQQ07383.1 hypothetical protein [Novosphingobium sp.]
MTSITSLSKHFATAVSALALSFVLISGTVSTPSTAQTAGAYVGAVA